MYKNFFKRLIDFCVSFGALILLSPFFLLIMIGLLFANTGKPFFSQERPGKNGNTFKIIKFKTMNDKKDKDGELLPPKKRITSFGRMLRASSLDELPQLINVLKGEMSLIGPRPLRVEYLPLYNDFQRRRHDVKPGITGWAQVNGRNALTWEQKFEFDVFYVDNLSFKLDLKIIFLTIKKVLKKEGVDKSEEFTMEPFKGSNDINQS